MSTYIHLELINSSAREVFFRLWSKKKSGGRVGRGEKNMAQNSETTSELKKTVDPQTLADGSISVRGKLMDTL